MHSMITASSRHHQVSVPTTILILIPPQSSFSSTEGTYTRLSSLPKSQTMAALSSTSSCRTPCPSLLWPR
ncbi:hypothetical protein INR49_001901 [Caranx melampygus]|nr:hypothetical protein INR49_001901 [Caranx melampygus]